MRPDERLSSLFVWLLAVTAKRHRVVVHVATVMSTHYHLVVSVPGENVSELAHDLNMLLANAICVLRKFVSGVVWEPGGLNIVELQGATYVIVSLVIRRPRSRPADPSVHAPPIPVFTPAIPVLNEAAPRRVACSPRGAMQ